MKLFYALGSEPSLKQAVVASLPDPIQVAINQNLYRQKVFKDFLHGDRMIDKACTDSHLKIKCGKEDKSCYCPTKKKKHFRREKGARNLKPQNKVRWRYLKKKKKLSKKGKSTRCYICNKKGHFAKDCPKNKKGAKMIKQIQQRSGIKITDEDDIESLFSIDDEPND
ncbi:terminal uridylyltransferase 7-like [Gossypium hirsutum]|uniref:Terminal uridylyltransferase 7-like n=1 Tax=Gossypium hirsutum TaxID=3635 RepID=A0ABM3BA82_GOSHI|nr:terminal uridylyltransferase 7-like [Gossypium hirsutum]